MISQWRKLKSISQILMAKNKVSGMMTVVINTLNLWQIASMRKCFKKKMRRIKRNPIAPLCLIPIVSINQVMFSHLMNLKMKMMK